jgi:DNA-damage-inducible protein D
MNSITLAASDGNSSFDSMNVGNSVSENFLLTSVRSQGRDFEDYRLSRYACYLVAMNGDPDKPEIAAAQSYFATKTREAELNPFEGLAEMIAAAAKEIVQRELLKFQPQPSELEQRLDQHECEIGRIFKPDGQFFSIRGWANHQKVKVNLKEASDYGRAASKLSKQLGIATDKLPDARYGQVKAYHESVLAQIF